MSVPDYSRLVGCEETAMTLELKQKLTFNIERAKIMSTTKTYDDTNTGIIGKNDFKQKDTHPDQRGRINIAGIWYWLSGWEKTANGRTFCSLAATEMTQAEVDTMLEKRAAKQAPQQGSQQVQQQQAQRPAQAQAQQPQQQSAPVVQNNEPPMDFDDDIPF